VERVGFELTGYSGAEQPFEHVKQTLPGRLETRSSPGAITSRAGARVSARRMNRFMRLPELVREEVVEGLTSVRTRIPRTCAGSHRPASRERNSVKICDTLYANLKN
jgi:hypothetical protein